MITTDKVSRAALDSVVSKIDPIIIHQESKKKKKKQSKKAQLRAAKKEGFKEPAVIIMKIFDGSTVSGYSTYQPVA